MFKDYYKILGIKQDASAEEIKSAYRAMSIKWHPDKNINRDVTKIMQDINEAYYILKDEQKKKKYDCEYARFKTHIHNNNDYVRKKTKYAESCYYDYDVQDDDLSEDINDAYEYARNIVAEFIDSLKRNSINAAKGAYKELKVWLFAGVITMIIFILIQNCQNI